MNCLLTFILTDNVSYTHMKNIKNKIIIFSFLTAVFLFSPFLTPSLFAVSYGGFGIRPANPDPDIPLSDSWFIYNLLPGEKKEDAFIVSNTSEETLSAEIYPVDGTTTGDGSFALLEKGSDRKEIGTWVKLAKNKVTLSPGEEEKIFFTITIPGGTAVGDHLGGIVLENLAVTKGKGVNVVTRVGVRIYETVPGQLTRKLNLANFSWKLVNNNLTFYFELENAGNVHLDPTGKLIIKDGFLGLTLASFDLNLGMVLPGKPTKVPLVWAGAWPLGKFRAIAEINYGEKPAEVVMEEMEFGYLTGRAVTLLVVLLVLGLVLAARSFVFSSKR